MVEIDARRRSALAPLKLAPATADPAGVRLCELGHLGKVNLRLDSADQDAVAALEAIGIRLPGEANGVAAADRRVLWLGPDECLIVTAQGDEVAIQQQASQALAGRHHALTDLTDNYTTIRVAGPSAEALLAKGCPLDLHGSVFPAGRVAQSLIGAVDMILECLADGAGGRMFLLFVRRSFAQYTWDWLADGALEFGLTIEV